jgi:uncharacterized protein involved in exopolysaccharide biosynthesis
METLRTKILGFALLLAGLALCGAGLWLLLSPAQYQATVRIKSEFDGIGINGPVNVYDPYFIQTEFQIIQSSYVLSNVVQSLNLNVEWGKKYGDGNPLETVKTIKLLQRRMNLEPVRNSIAIKISFISEDPDEAARIANAIANAYRDYRLKLHQQLATNGIEVLEQSYQKEDEQIRVLQSNVDLPREKFKIQNDTSPPPNQSQTFNSTSLSSYGNGSTNALAEQPYWEAKRDLESKNEFHKLLAAKIAAAKLVLQYPKTSMVEIVDVAQPPKFSASPNRWLGVALLAIGLFPTIGGFLLLKSSFRRAE